MRHKARKVPEMRERGRGRGSSTFGARGVGYSPRPSQGVQLRRLPSSVFAYLQRRSRGRGKMGSEGRKRNQSLFFIFDKVIKTRWSAPRAGSGSPFPGGGHRPRGPQGLPRGREAISSLLLQSLRASPRSSRPPSLPLGVFFPLGRKQGSLQAEESHVEGG